jgi:hypothetical protein
MHTHVGEAKGVSRQQMSNRRDLVQKEMEGGFHEET